jgi:hypothetical protein
VSVSPSGSVEVEPDRVIDPFAATVVGPVMCAIGGRFTSLMVTVVVEVLVPWMPVAVSLKSAVASAATSGATKVGWAAVGSFSVIAGPEVCVQCRAGGVVPAVWVKLPESCPVARSLTVTGGPALAVGHALHPVRDEVHEGSVRDPGDADVVEDEPGERAARVGAGAEADLDRLVGEVRPEVGGHQIVGDAARGDGRRICTTPGRATLERIAEAGVIVPLVEEGDVVVRASVPPATFTSVQGGAVVDR